MTNSRNGDKPELHSRGLIRIEDPGRPWEEWSAMWWQWCSTEPLVNNPVIDNTGDFVTKTKMTLIFGFFQIHLEAKLNVHAQYQQEGDSISNYE